MGEEHTAVPAEKPHSVKISSNAKGETACEIKVYGEDPTEARQVALREYRQLKAELARG